MIKRLLGTFALVTALVVGSGVGVAEARPHSHIHGFQQCMDDARAAFQQAKKSGGSRHDARVVFLAAQQHCRQNFKSPRGA